MGRSSRDQRGQFSTMVRYDGRGRIIPGSNILKKGQKPQEGRWQKKDAYECCDPFSIGQFYQGGIIASDIVEDQVMIINLDNLGQAAWTIGATTLVGTQAGLKEGQPNTDAIISVGSPTPNAASVCRAGIIDWDLPSQDELNEVYVNRTLVNSGIVNSGGTPVDLSKNYWSSTENNINSAWKQNFSNGNQVQGQKSDNPYVRAVRWVNI